MSTRMALRSSVILLSSLIIALPLLVAAHDEHKGHDMGGMHIEHGSHAGINHGSNTTMPGAAGEDKMSYWKYPSSRGVLYAHIVFMTLGWIFALPVAVMLGIARSSLYVLFQGAFLLLTGLGVGSALLYNASTPDLYPGNAHHKLGWVIVFTVVAQTGLSFLGMLFRKSRTDSPAYKQLDDESAAFMTENNNHDRMSFGERHSEDSGHGTDRMSTSSTLHGGSPMDEERPFNFDNEDEEQYKEVDLSHPTSSGGRLGRFVSAKLPGLLTSRAYKIISFTDNFISRSLLIIAMIQYSLGIITVTRMFDGPSVFNGLAHFIKGGIFFCYGIFTLVRWAGCFADLSWAWNVVPANTRKRAPPTVEFIESALIFTYGFINVWIEHLASWGHEWSHMDLEHVSIAFLFLGGGLCGLLIESKKVKSLLNAANFSEGPDTDPEEKKATPKVINPMPAVIIFLLGPLMSGHDQHGSMLGSTIHKQWGNLLACGAAARIATYVLLYLRPSTSHLPSRPMTEVLGSFCLISGGMIFISSNSDTVNALTEMGVPAGFVFTVALGFTSLLMSWVVAVVAIKGLAMKREARRKRNMVSSLRG